MSLEARWSVPKGWSWTSLEDIAEVTGGGTPPANDPRNFADDGGIPWITPADLTGYEGTYIGRGRRNLSEHGYKNSAAKLLPAGSVLFTSRAPIGYCAIAANPITTNQGFKSLTLFEGISGEFVRHYLKWSKPFLESLASGTTFLELSGSKFGRAPLPLAPLSEQERIVDKLDALSAKSARARTELARIETLVSRYKQAVLSKAFSGSIVNTKAGERGGANKRRLAEICETITDGDHQAPPKAPSGVPFITISAMNDGRIDLGKASRFVPRSYYEELQSSRKARIGDILYSVTGSYGIPAIVETDRPFVFQRHIAIIRPDTTIVSEKYLERLLGSPQVREQADAIATGTAQKTVPLKGLRNFAIPVLPLDEQHEIVRLIEGAFGKINRLANEAKRALELVGRLDEAILAKAFRGELVSQNENDEPAETLLERISAERAATPKAKPKSIRRKSIMPTAKTFLTEKMRDWPEDGINFQKLRAEFSGSYDDLKEAVFSLLSDEEPMIQQVYDEKNSMLTLRKRGR